MGIKVFYDKYEKVTLWGKDLYAHLQEIYLRRARYVVMFVSRSYRNRLWTNHERKSAQARAFEENREYILPARFDGTRVPGLLGTTGYVDLRETRPEELAVLIRKKVGAIERNEFFPATPDRLFKPLQAKSKRQRQLVLRVAYHYFEMTKLMTRDERLLIASACQHACPCGIPKDVHLRLDYLARFLGASEKDIRSMAARLDCLSIKSRVFRKKENGHTFPVIEFRFVPLLMDCPSELGTPVMYAMHECLFETLCPECGDKAIARADFAQLSNATSFDENRDQGTGSRTRRSRAAPGSARVCLPTMLPPVSP
jgi:predicted RNA-binding Zn-ribbon protein involved in translation (DUF1610 family)